MFRYPEELKRGQIIRHPYLKFKAVFLELRTHPVAGLVVCDLETGLTDVWPVPLDTRIEVENERRACA